MSINIRLTDSEASLLENLLEIKASMRNTSTTNRRLYLSVLDKIKVQLIAKEETNEPTREAD